ncbi:hypothetical protein [Rhabdothermincola sediminis]|nr:hypothetical protein [Rhabdothermincola sediminis]
MDDDDDEEDPDDDAGVPTVLERPGVARLDAVELRAVERDPSSGTSR